MRESAIGNDAVKPDSHLNWNRFECFEVKLGQKFAVEHQISIKFVIKNWSLNKMGERITKVNQKIYLVKMEMQHKAPMNRYWCFDELSECCSEETFKTSRYSME